MKKRMKRKNSVTKEVSMSADPSARLCSKYDATGMKKFEAASHHMGIPIMDDCAEEHIQ